MYVPATVLRCLLALFGTLLSGCPVELRDAARDARSDTQIVTLDARHDLRRPADSGGGDALPHVRADGAPDSGPGNSSAGSGGAYPGAQARDVIAGSATFTYHLYLPAAYDPQEPCPLLSVFHGQGDTGAAMRDYWISTAESNGFIVLATTSTGSSGGWSGGTDLPRYEAALNDALGAYNVATDRLYVWGFSAGAHLTHAIALLNADYFAAYAVNAGVLAAFAGSDAPAAAPRKIPVSIRIGDADPMLAYARQDRDHFKAAGWSEGQNLAYSEFSGGHQLPPGDLQLAWDQLRGHRRP